MKTRIATALLALIVIDALPAAPQQENSSLTSLSSAQLQQISFLLTALADQHNSATVANTRRDFFVKQYGLNNDELTALDEALRRMRELLILQKERAAPFLGTKSELTQAQRDAIRSIQLQKDSAAADIIIDFLRECRFITATRILATPAGRTSKIRQ